MKIEVAELRKRGGEQTQERSAEDMDFEEQRDDRRTREEPAHRKHFIFVQIKTLNVEFIELGGPALRAPKTRSKPSGREGQPKHS